MEWEFQMFTSTEAYEAWKAGRPIMITPGAARAMCRRHDANLPAFIDEQCNGRPQDSYDAWLVLGWLGY